jgi:hypothetical protein
VPCWAAASPAGASSTASRSDRLPIFIDIMPFVSVRGERPSAGPPGRGRAPAATCAAAAGRPPGEMDHVPLPSLRTLMRWRPPLLLPPFMSPLLIEPLFIDPLFIDPLFIDPLFMEPLVLDRLERLCTSPVL